MNTNYYTTALKVTLTIIIMHVDNVIINHEYLYVPSKLMNTYNNGLMELLDS